MGKLQINGKTCELSYIIECTEYNMIYALSKMRLSSTEFSKELHQLLPTFASAKVREFAEHLKADDSKTIAAKKDDSWLKIQQFILKSFNHIPSPITTVMWPKDYEAVSSHAVICMQDESILLDKRESSSIRFIGTIDLDESIALFIYNEDIAFLFHISPNILYLEYSGATIREHIVTNLHDIHRPMNVMILGGAPEHNNMLMAVLYTLARLADEHEEYIFNITHQATLERNYDPISIPLEQRSASDQELIRLGAWNILEDEITIAQNTLFPDAPPDIKAAIKEKTLLALDISNAELFRQEHPPKELTDVMQFLIFLFSQSRTAQLQSKEAAEVLLKELSLSHPFDSDTFAMLIGKTLRSIYALELHQRMVLDEHYFIPRYHAFILELAKPQQAHLLSVSIKHPLCVAQQWRSSSVLNKDSLEHIVVDGYRITLPLRNIKKIFFDSSFRRSVMTICEGATDSSDMTSLVRRTIPNLNPEMATNRGLFRSFFETCNLLNTASTSASIDLFRCFVPPESSAVEPASWQKMFTVLSLLILLQPSDDVHIEMRRRSGSSNEIYDVLLICTMATEETVSKKLSQSHITHYRLAVKELNTHCIYIEKADIAHNPNLLAAASRFFSQAHHETSTAAHVLSAPLLGLD